MSGQCEISQAAMEHPLVGSRLGKGDCLRQLLRRPTLLVFLRHGG